MVIIRLIIAGLLGYTVGILMVSCIDRHSLCSVSTEPISVVENCKD